MLELKNINVSFRSERQDKIFWSYPAAGVV